jgi:hypothetical protein
LVSFRFDRFRFVSIGFVSFRLVSFRFDFVSHFTGALILYLKKNVPSTRIDLNTFGLPGRRTT